MNIYDVSERAHVSIATVSRVLNGNPNVSEKTRLKVISVMEELGYTPNIFARSLGLNTMKTIGIMCADSSDPYLANAIYYLEQELRRYGYDSILCCSGYAPETKKKYLELLLSKRVDAIILAGSHYVEPRKKDNEYLMDAAKKLPVMLVNGRLEGQNIYSVLCDDRGAVKKAASALLNAGRQSILYLYCGSSYSNMEKLRGYRDAFTAAGLTVKEKLICLCPKNLDACTALLNTICEEGTEFDAVLAAEDLMAVSAVKYAHKKKLAIPQQLNIIGYNNSILSRCTDPEITSVDNQVEALCTTTVNTLMKVLDGGTPPACATLSANLICRGTTEF